MKIISKNKDVISGAEAFDMLFLFLGIPILFVVAMISGLVKAIKGNQNGDSSDNQ